MAMKRKRSSDVLSSPSSTADLVSQPNSISALPNFYQQSKPVEPTYEKPDHATPSPNDESPWHLNSRTRKRHRDNRPDEEDVFASTLDKLFRAQRLHPQAEPVISEEPLEPSAIERPQRSTLHTFWNLGRPPLASVTEIASLPSDESSNVQARRPAEEDAMDVDDGAVT